MVEIPDIVMIPREKIRPNQYNPNEFDDDLFNALVQSIEEDGFIQPILVGPLGKNDDYEFEIIDGEHRWTALDLLEVPDIPCIVRDVDEDERIKLTVRTYRLRGKFNSKKFTELIEKQMEKFSLEEVAERFAFPDPDELSEMIENARESLPTSEMKDAFDAAKDDIKTVDELSNVLNRLFTKFGDTLPANFMVLDFGGKRHIWVRMDAKAHKLIASQAREVLSEGVTFDSFITHLLTVVPVSKTVAKFRDFLEEVKQDDTNIDDLVE